MCTKKASKQERRWTLDEMNSVENTEVSRDRQTAQQQSTASGSLGLTDQLGTLLRCCLSREESVNDINQTVKTKKATTEMIGS